LFLDAVSGFDVPAASVQVEEVVGQVFEFVEVGGEWFEIVIMRRCLDNQFERCGLSAAVLHGVPLEALVLCLTNLVFDAAVPYGRHDERDTAFLEEVDDVDGEEAAVAVDTSDVNICCASSRSCSTMSRLSENLETGSACNV